MPTSLILTNPTPNFDANHATAEYRQVRELHSLKVTGEHLTTVHWGAFYGIDFDVVDADSGLPYSLDVDFTFGLLQAEPTMKSGNAVFTVVEFDSVKYPIPPNVYFTYWFVAGKYGTNSEALITAIGDIDTKPSTVYWSNVLQRPIAYPPAFHFHDASTIIGLGPTNTILVGMITALEELAIAVSLPTVPDYIVEYGGAQKLSRDRGIVLHDYNTTVSLVVPRSTNEDAIVTLNFNLCGKRIAVSFTEHPSTGYGYALIDSDLTSSLGLTAELHYVLGGRTQSVTMTVNSNFENNTHLILTEVLVHTDNYLEFNEGYVWAPDGIAGTSFPCGLHPTS